MRSLILTFAQSFKSCSFNAVFASAGTQHFEFITAPFSSLDFVVWNGHHWKTGEGVWGAEGVSARREYYGGHEQVSFMALEVPILVQVFILLKIASTNLRGVAVFVAIHHIAQHTLGFLSRTGVIDKNMALNSLAWLLWLPGVDSYIWPGTWMTDVSEISWAPWPSS